MTNPFNRGDEVHWANEHRIPTKDRESYQGTVTETKGDVCFVEWDQGGQGDKGVHHHALTAGTEWGRQVTLA